MDRGEDERGSQLRAFEPEINGAFTTASQSISPGRNERGMASKITHENVPGQTGTSRVRVMEKSNDTRRRSESLFSLASCERNVGLCAKPSVGSCECLLGGDGGKNSEQNNIGERT